MKRKQNGRSGNLNRSRLSATESSIRRNSIHGRQLLPGIYKIVLADEFHKFGYHAKLTISEEDHFQLQFENDKNYKLYARQPLKTFNGKRTGALKHFHETSGGADQIIFDSNWSSGIYVTDDLQAAIKIWIRWELVKPIPDPSKKAA